jgi:hypothetical protein
VSAQTKLIPFGCKAKIKIDPAFGQLKKMGLPAVVGLFAVLVLAEPVHLGGEGFGDKSAQTS